MKKFGKRFLAVLCLSALATVSVTAYGATSDITSSGMMGRYSVNTSDSAQREYNNDYSTYCGGNGSYSSDGDYNHCFESEGGYGCDGRSGMMGSRMMGSRMMGSRMMGTNSSYDCVVDGELVCEGGEDCPNLGDCEANYDTESSYSEPSVSRRNSSYMGRSGAMCEY